MTIFHDETCDNSLVLTVIGIFPSVYLNLNLNRRYFPLTSGVGMCGIHVHKRLWGFNPTRGGVLTPSLD